MRQSILFGYRNRLAATFSLLIVCVIWTSAAQAGSGPAKLSCVSANRQLSVKGNIPGSEYALDLIVREGKEELPVTGASEAYSASVVEDFRRGVFTMIVYGESTIQMYAIPSTVKAKVTYGTTHASFDAIFDVLPKPSSKDKKDYWSYDDYRHGVRMRCVYDYSI